MKKNVVIKVEHLKSYYILDIYGTKKYIKAVNDVSLEFYENEVYGIAGESGCGKSTLVKSIFGLITPPLSLMGGKVLYNLNGRMTNLYELEDKECNALKWNFISYIPQGSMSVLNPVLKIKDIFKDFIEDHIDRKMDKHEIYTAIENHLEQLGLPMKILNAYPHQLSGGMRQRVTIALATILKPKVIIADEPTTALDVVVQRGVIQLLREIHSLQKNTIILVTHDMGVHANIADRIGIMYAGRIIEEGDVKEIFENPIHPYTKYLIFSLPKFGDKTRKESAPGNPPSLSNLPPGCEFHPRCPYTLDICKTNAPFLIDIGNDHKVACWLVKEGNNAKTP